MDLNTVWFLLIGVLIAVYAVLDGFDLGVGILQFFTQNEDDRKTLLRSIAPFWDGNEVWLLMFGGALFAAFPDVYATVFSGFYLVMILLLVGLIFRVLSIEFRNQIEAASWRNFWDKAFSVSSLVVTLLLGIALGNILTGVPLDSTTNYSGSFFSLLKPLPVLIGLISVLMFMMQGAAFLILKTEGVLAATAERWLLRLWKLYLLLFVLTSLLIAVTDLPRMSRLFDGIWGYLVFLILLCGIVSLPLFLKKKRYKHVFTSSSLIILSMIAIVGVTIYPNLVPDTLSENSLTIYNSSSSSKTLTVMLIMVIIGMPLVVAYTTYVYRLFRKTV